MPDPELGALAALRRLRRVETDMSRRAVGEAVTCEMTLAAQIAAVGQELSEARQIAAEFDREVYAAWLVRMLAVRGSLGDAIREAEATTASARELLAQRRVAETIAGEAYAAAVLALQSAVERREQVTLEDVARGLRRTSSQSARRRGFAV